MHFFLPLLSVLLLLDLVSKLAAQQLLPASALSLWGEYVKLQLSFNTGIAFSLPVPYWMQIALTVIFFIAFFIWARKYFYDTSRLEQIGITFFVAGALGNFWERVVNQQVTDFISISFPPYHFPIFNFADVFISIGFLLWFWGATRAKKK